MPTPFDLAVIGAGPGGSNAAAVALRHGLSVVQIEKHPFPRTKPCAGALTRKAWSSLQLELQPSLRREFHSFEFNAWKGRGTRFGYEGRFLAMVRRPEFDEDLVRQNREHGGFRFLDGEALRDVVHDGKCFRLETDARTLLARQLVGADGANGIVDRRFRIGRPRGRAVAVEINPTRAELGDVLPARPCFDFGAVERGYGWVFPKDDHASIGLYVLLRENESRRDLRVRLLEYVGARGLSVRGDPLATFEAHLIPLGGYRPRVPDLPVYLVGDAGGFADALTGEGIYHALESGRLAGETAVRVARGTARPRNYYRRLRKTVLADTWISWWAAKAFYRDAGRSLAFLRLPFVWRPLVEGYGRGATLARCLARGGFYLLGSRRSSRATV